MEIANRGGGIRDIEHIIRVHKVEFIFAAHFFLQTLQRDEHALAEREVVRRARHHDRDAERFRRGGGRRGSGGGRRRRRARGKRDEREHQRDDENIFAGHFLLLL